MKIYLVGGAVRDRLLGLPVQERDWVVVGATEDEMLAAGFRCADIEADFPVFRHPDSGEEYALARTESKTGLGYKGFAIEAGPGITLEQDLARRDLTLNALAEDEEGRLIDLFGGRDDLEAKTLRHITPAFEEDPVRILRVARFAARLGPLGFDVAPETLELMSRMAQSDDLKALKLERVWREMQKALGEGHPWRFFQVLHDCGALTVLVPHLDAAIGKSAVAAIDPLAALQNAAGLCENRAVRFAAVMYAAMEGDGEVDNFCNSLRAERDCCDMLELVVRQGPAFSMANKADAEALLDLLEQTRALQQEGRFERFMLACKALWPEPAEAATKRLTKAMVAVAAIEAKDLLEEGLSGPELGAELKRRRVQSIQEKIGG